MSLVSTLEVIVKFDFIEETSKSGAILKGVKEGVKQKYAFLSACLHSADVYESQPSISVTYGCLCLGPS